MPNMTGMTFDEFNAVNGNYFDKERVREVGKAGDFTITGMTAEQARQAIKKNASLLPCNIRMEKAVSWLHFDVLPQYEVTEKVYEFNG